LDLRDWRGGDQSGADGPVSSKLVGVTERRLDRGVSDGWAWRRWNGQIVEDTDPVAYGDAWHYLLGRVVVEAARLELELALLAAAGSDVGLEHYRRYLGPRLRDDAWKAARRPTAPPGARDAVRAAKAALTRRDSVIHWPPVAVVVPDGDPPQDRRSASGRWRMPTRDEHALPVDVATVAELQETLAALQAAWWPVAEAARGVHPPTGQS